jgi:hydrogenase assembly chaperone HypC/HupF
MCIEAPGQIVALDSSGAVVELDGRRRRASTLLHPDAAVGDWVTVAAGTIVSRISAAEAADIASILRAARLAHNASPQPRQPRSTR